MTDDLNKVADEAEWMRRAFEQQGRRMRAEEERDEARAEVEKLRSILLDRGDIVKAQGHAGLAYILWHAAGLDADAVMQRARQIDPA